MASGVFSGHLKQMLFGQYHVSAEILFIVMSEWLGSELALFMHTTRSELWIGLQLYHEVENLKVSESLSNHPLLALV